ncbi:MAG TPA: DUF4870 domain-containing protein [Polyangiaceae bacterium]
MNALPFENEASDAYRSPAPGAEIPSLFGPSKSERLAAAVAHAGTIFAWFLAPLLVYLVKRGESKYVEFQAMQALLWSLGGTVISFATCGLAIPVFLVWHVVAAARVLDESTVNYEYPIVGAMARAIVDA